MDSTVAVALIAVGGTVGSAGLSYLGSKHNTETQLKVSEESSKAQLRMAEKSTDNQLQSIQVDLKRLEDSQAQELRSARQRLYQDYLSAAYELRDFFIHDSRAGDEEALNTVATAFRQREIEIELLASGAVKERAEALYDLLFDTFVVLDESEFPESMDMAKQLARAFEPAASRWRPVRDALITAMRAELTPVASP